MSDPEFKKAMAQIRANHKAKAEANRRASMSEYERNREDRIRKAAQQMEDARVKNTLKLKVKKLVKELESQEQPKPAPSPKNSLQNVRIVGLHTRYKNQLLTSKS